MKSIKGREEEGEERGKSFTRAGSLSYLLQFFSKARRILSTLGPPRYLLKEIKCGRQREGIRGRKKGKGGREERKEEQKESQNL